MSRNDAGIVRDTLEKVAHPSDQAVDIVGVRKCFGRQKNVSNVKNAGTWKVDDEVAVGMAIGYVLLRCSTNDG